MKYKNSEITTLVEQNLSVDQLAKSFDVILSKERSEHSELKNEYERLSSIINLIPNPISLVNSDMTYFGVNKALADSCGVSPADFIGRPIGFFRQELFFYEFVQELFRSQNDTVYRHLDARISGVDRTFLVTGTKLEDKKKAVIIGVDITELTNLLDHFSFTEKLVHLGEMFAGILHDINNPLMMIEGTTKRLQRLLEDREAKELVSKIEMSSQKISKIVKSVKTYVRKDAEEPAAMENLGLIIDDALIICEHKLKENMVGVTLDPALNKIVIPCHFTKIFQVFVNLISNSVDAISTLKEKSIEITAMESDGKYIIRFQDSGDGIPLEHQEKIFNAFFTTKNRGIGLGLGLSLCRKLLEEQGGHLSVDNSAAHTTFIIEFKK